MVIKPVTNVRNDAMTVIIFDINSGQMDIDCKIQKISVVIENKNQSTILATVLRLLLRIFVIVILSGLICLHLPSSNKAQFTTLIR